ncbi:MAG: DUF547 domain-containing protein [Saprospiraceae bacterium]|nr:DUF547 domain-containing protein [Saprospiraceae bacterium]
MTSFRRIKPAYWTGIFLSIIASLPSCKVKEYVSDSKPVDHSLWDQLTRKHVHPEGYVDYAGFVADSNLLVAYLDMLSENHPNDTYWSRDQQLAYWINAYNAFTVKLIVDHYPVIGIKEIKNGIPFVNTVWDIKFIRIEGQSYDLNNIEHGIIRQKFNEPRIHFAVNCASVSCPNLRNEAYTAPKLDQQLSEQTYRFLADINKNEILEDQLYLSKIFFWYGTDFKKNGKKVTDFIRKYTDHKISDNPKVKYLEYDWNLNVRENMTSE